MTISSATNKVLLNGDGSTTTFTFNFALLKSDYSDLYVYQIDIDEDTQEETQTLLTAGVDYSVSVLKDTNLNILGGSITTTFVPTINQKIFIVREENLLQETKIEINQKFPERVIELTLDKLTLQNQQQQSLIDKCLKISQTSDAVISNFADTPVENMGVVWKKNDNGEFYLSNTQDNPDTIYNDIVNNANVIAVSNNIDNINAVANNSTNIDAVAGNSTNINVVASNIANVNSVGANISNVNSVATNSTNINSVAGDLTNIDNVASDLTNISNVASDLSNVDIVATNISNVNTNATNISSINTNATNISNINIVATNISDIQDKANKDLDNITNTGKNVITSLVGWEKISEFEIDNVAEIEFTGLNDGYQHRFEFIDFAPSVQSYMHCEIGNNGTYFNTGYSYSYIYQDSNNTSVWMTNSKYGYNTSKFWLTADHRTEWYLQPNKNSYFDFSILSDFTKDGIKLFKGNTICPDSTTTAYMLSTRFEGLLNTTGKADRVKFYLSSGNFASGTIKHYIMK